MATFITRSRLPSVWVLVVAALVAATVVQMRSTHTWDALVRAASGERAPAACLAEPPFAACLAARARRSVRRARCAGKPGAGWPAHKRGGAAGPGGERRVARAAS